MEDINLSKDYVKIFNEAEKKARLRKCHAHFGSYAPKWEYQIYSPTKARQQPESWQQN